MKCKVFITSDLKIGISAKEMEEILPASMFGVVSINSDEQMLNEHALLDASEKYDAIVTTISDKVTSKHLSKKRIKLISNIAVGFDNIDLETAKSEKIAVTNTPDSLNTTTAEMAVTLLLNALRQVKFHQHYHQNGNCTHWRPFFGLGSELRGKEVGIVGLGRIGREIAKILHFGFNCKINYLLNEKVHQLEFPTNPLSQIEFFTSQKLIILAAPLNEKTVNLINHEKISMMPIDVILVNIGRGELVDQQALTKNLDKFSAIATDVTTPDPLPASHPLMKNEKVFITPHIGSATKEARKAMALLALKNVRGHFDPNYQFSPHYVF